MTEVQKDALGSEVALSYGLNPDLRFDPVPGNAKKAMENIGTKKDMFGVDLRHTIVIEGFNPRIKDELYWERVRKLKESIQANGWYPDKPLAGFAMKKDGKDVIVIVEGGRRRDAGLMLLEEYANQIPEGVADEDLSPEAMQAKAFIENFRAPMVSKKAGTSELDLQYGLAGGNDSEPFRPYELAVLIKRLHVVFDQTEKQILDRLPGVVSASHLPKLLMLASAPREIVEAVDSGNLSVTESYDLMKKHGDKAVEVLRGAAQLAKAVGAKKVMPKHMPGARFDKALLKESKPLYDVAKQIQSDKGYAGLSEETRAVLDDMLREISELKAKCDDQDQQALQKARDTEAAEAGQTNLDMGKADNDEDQKGQQVA